MDSTLFTEIKNEIRDRADWEDSQAVYYKLRYEGIGRAVKPYANAPDMHYALVDSMIEKLKPLYIGQIYDQQMLATFTSGIPQADTLTNSAEKLFDYLIRQKTNFENSIFTSIDHMLMYGRGPVKIYWDADKKQICFAPIRPIYLIVPNDTEELQSSDWLVQVIHLSERQYLASAEKKGWNKTDSFIKSIKGNGDGASTNSTEHEDAIRRRKGITCGMNDRQIVLWEVYKRDGDKINVELMSPLMGTDEPVAPDMGLPYTHGQLPYADMRYELCDPDFYSPRGVAEILKHHEMDLCKLWNHKLQFLDYFGQPTFKNTGTMASPPNFQASPGKILPQGIEPNDGRSAPMDFKQEMELQRALAEDRVQVPDLSVGQHLSGGGKPGSGKDPTATQINALVMQSGQGNDMRSRIFRKQLSVAFLQAWSLATQYLDTKKQVLDDFTEVPQEAIHGNYRVEPSGTPNSETKQARMAKSLALYQILQGNPYIKQGESTKRLLEQDSPALVERLYEEPADQQADEIEDQANEIMLMEYGFPASVDKADDDKAHLHCMGLWGDNRIQVGPPVAPEFAARLLQHGQEHAMAIEQKKDKEGKQLVKQLTPLFGMLQQIVGQGQMMQAAQQGDPAAMAAMQQQTPQQEQPALTL